MDRITAEGLIGLYSDDLEYVNIDHCGYVFMLRHVIGIQDVSEIVWRVVQACFIDDGEYRPEFRDFMLRSEVIDKYTNIMLPDDIHERYDILYRSGIFGTVISNINSDQFDQIMHSIDLKVKYISDSNVSMIESKINEVYESIKDVITKMNATLDGVDNDALVGFINAFSKGLDEMKLAKALLSESKNVNK